MPRRDQVKITYGPARYDSPKAIRKQIEDSKQETQESTVQEIINDPTILPESTGRGGFVGEVTAYDPATRDGDALFDGDTYDFSNATGTSLDIGDTVFITESGGEYYAVGIVDRVGDITPVPLPPAAALSPDFPITTEPTLPFDINLGAETGLGYPPVAGAGTNRSRGYQLVFDLAGSLTLGTDTIVGPNLSTSATAINAFTRSTSLNVSLYAPSITTSPDLYIQQGNGTLITCTAGNSQVRYRRPGDLSWTNTTTYVNNAFDLYTENLWGWEWSSAGVGASVFYRMSSADSAPVSKGALGIPNSTSTAFARVLVAGHGFLAAILIGSTTVQFYLKPANDDTNFVLAGTAARSSWSGASNWLTGTTDIEEARDIRITPNGDVTYILQDGTTGTWHMRLLEQGTSIVFDYDLGVPSTFIDGFGTTRGKLQGHTHAEGGLVLLPGIADDTELGFATPGFYPVIAAYNYVNTTYVFSDEYMYSPLTAINNALQSTIPIEVTTGSFRFGTRSSTASEFRVYEISGL